MENKQPNELGPVQGYCIRCNLNCDSAVKWPAYPADALVTVHTVIGGGSPRPFAMCKEHAIAELREQIKATAERCRALLKGGK